MKLSSQSAVTAVVGGLIVGLAITYMLLIPAMNIITCVELLSPNCTSGLQLFHVYVYTYIRIMLFFFFLWPFGGHPDCWWIWMGWDHGTVTPAGS